MLLKLHEFKQNMYLFSVEVVPQRRDYSRVGREIGDGLAEFV